MKKSLLFILICVFVSFVSAQDVAKSDDEETIVFAEKAHDFGVISSSDGMAVYEFTLKNTGKEPLLISRVTASCGCTTPDWTKQPIEPGKKGSIKVSFNPNGQSGAFSKTVTVYSNANPMQVRLIIKGTVD